MVSRSLDMNFVYRHIMETNYSCRSRFFVPLRTNDIENLINAQLSKISFLHYCNTVIIHCLFSICECLMFSLSIILNRPIIAFTINLSPFYFSCSS